MVPHNKNIIRPLNSNSLDFEAELALSSPISQYHLFWRSLIRFPGRVVSCSMRDEV